ncbi:anaerobic ribonucleoside triphosphate reductase [Mollicutes bacterium LVI A0039]|nr:anaerobic ribonucleoside triphosphate reductase [Mollicutes bacterium LVI A0039]
MNSSRLEQEIKEIVGAENQDLIQENANTDGKSPMGIMSLIASSTAKEYALDMLRPDIREAFGDGYIHIHDFDFYATGTTTCCQIPLGKVLKDGFTVGNCFMREPQTISSAMSLASILIQSNQNQQHGGQSYPHFDFDLAKYAEKSYNRHIRQLTELDLGIEQAKIEEIAMQKAEDETYQGAESFVHNANSMLTRNGMQVPFVSINFGLDTSVFGRMVSRNILKAQRAGLGDGSTPLFPILVFKVKEGINLNPEDPNYDLYELSLDCLSKRLFPNFQFVDTPFNSVGFDPKDPSTHIATMGCRTRIFEDLHGKNTVDGRGNLSFTTINLPMVAMDSENVEDFFAKLDNYMELASTQLLDRLEYQKSRVASSFKMLYGEGLWNGGDEIDMNGQVGDVLNTGSLSIGFIGLAETLMILVGEHHGQSADAQELGLKIISFMRDKTNQKTKDHNLNFSLLATPAESYSGKSIAKFRAKFGDVAGITDYDFFTNSNHVPVYYEISAKKKIEIEAPYHALTNAGHIMYVELDGDAKANIEALDQVVRKMHQENVGYGSINHPLDRCRECGLQAIINEVCPNCMSTDISRIRRITGYLVGDMEKWNSAKRDEEQNRVKHGKN